MICFTSITNNYDTLKDPYISDGWEYVVFSDRYIEHPIWKCVVTDKHNRDIKIRPHLELFHTLSLWVDGSIEIVGDLNEFVSEVPNIYTAWKHPHRNCLYEELNAVVKMKGINPEEAKRQGNDYEIMGMPHDWGLAACGVLLRDLSSEWVRDMNEQWWSEYSKGIKRDQISYPFVFWKNGYQMDLFDNDIFNKYFKWGKHR